MPTPKPLSPFVTDLPGFDPDRRFVLDVSAFMAELADEAARWLGGKPPAFLADPRPEYLSACEMMPVLEVLAGH
jgi:hypothetical protein